MEEIWKPIINWDTYEVSSLGAFRNRITKRLLSLSLFKTGYVRVSLYNGQKSVSHSAHRLVGQAFLPNPENCPQVNHLDGNKQNNCVDNLRWESTSDNQKHSQEVLKNLNGRSKFRTQEERDSILNRYQAGESGAAIARSLGVSKSCISRLLRGETYIHQ